MGTSSGLQTPDDHALLRRAIRGRWPIPDHLRRRAVEVCAHTLESDDVDTETKLSAIKSLTVMDSINLKEEISDKPKLVVHQMSDNDIERRLREIEELQTFMEITQLTPLELE